MDFFVPRPEAKFDGNYTRFHLSHGGSLIVILCSVPGAKNGRPHNLTVTYVPPDDAPIWQAELWPHDFASFQHAQHRGPYALCAATEDSPLPGFNAPESSITNAITITHSQIHSHFTLNHGSASGLTLNATLTSHTPWNYKTTSPHTSSPEGPLVYLPLPLHWHVLSPFAPGTLSLKLPPSYPYGPKALEQETPCIAHLEKNWAHSFPRAHIWVQGIRIPGTPNKSSPSSSTTPTIQARSPPTQAESKHWEGQVEGQKAQQAHTLTLAGGLILGLEAYLVGYRNPSKSISRDFRPPFTLSLLPLLSTLLSYLPASLRSSLQNHCQTHLEPLLSPFTSVKRDWPTRSLKLVFSTLTHKIEIDAKAPKERFYTFAAPMGEGFRGDWMAQSLDGRAVVKVWRRDWGSLWRVPLGWCGLNVKSEGGGQNGWRLVCEDYFERCGVEFGGEYYPGRGRGMDGVVKWDGEDDRSQDVRQRLGVSDEP